MDDVLVVDVAWVGGLVPGGSGRGRGEWMSGWMSKEAPAVFRYLCLGIAAFRVGLGSSKR